MEDDAETDKEEEGDEGDDESNGPSHEHDDRGRDAAQRYRMPLSQSVPIHGADCVQLWKKILILHHHSKRPSRAISM